MFRFARHALFAFAIFDLNIRHLVGNLGGAWFYADFGAQLRLHLLECAANQALTRMGNRWRLKREISNDENVNLLASHAMLLRGTMVVR